MRRNWRWGDATGNCERERNREGNWKVDMWWRLGKLIKLFSTDEHVRNALESSSLFTSFTRNIFHKHTQRQVSKITREKVLFCLVISYIEWMIIIWSIHEPYCELFLILYRVDNDDGVEMTFLKARKSSHERKEKFIHRKVIFSQGFLKIRFSHRNTYHHT